MLGLKDSLCSAAFIKQLLLICGRGFVWSGVIGRLIAEGRYVDCVVLHFSLVSFVFKGVSLAFVVAVGCFFGDSVGFS